jgi:hypothetical protein
MHAYACMHACMHLMALFMRKVVSGFGLWSHTSESKHTIEMSVKFSDWIYFTLNMWILRHPCLSDSIWKQSAQGHLSPIIFIFQSWNFLGEIHVPIHHRLQTVISPTCWSCGVQAVVQLPQEYHLSLVKFPLSVYTKIKINVQLGTAFI